MSVIFVITPVLILLYAWGLYPALLGYFALRRKKEMGESYSEESGWPDLAIILSAHNEEDCIEDRIRNLQEIDYPRDRIRILVGNDGSQDGTAEIMERLASEDHRIQFQNFETNRGKVAVLKDLVAAVAARMSGGRGQATYDTQLPTTRNHEPRTKNRESAILVFTDANTHFYPEALKKLVAPLRNSEVGGVCGRLVLTEERSGFSIKCSELDAPPVIRMPGEEGHEFETPRQQGQETTDNKPLTNNHSLSTGNAPRSCPPEGFYWRWENTLKERESDVDSCLGANGAIYALRPGLFWEDLPDNTVVDDFVIGMKVRELGYRMVYEPSAVAVEELPEGKHEWGRRVRIGSGAFQALSMCRSCLLGRYGWFAWMFWSHKVLRWFTPHMMLSAVLGSALLLMATDRGPRTADIAGGVILLGAILVGFLAFYGGRDTGSNNGFMRLARLCNHFVVMQAALFAGFVRFLRGDLKGSWTRTPR